MGKTFGRDYHYLDVSLILLNFIACFDKFKCINEKVSFLVFHLSGFIIERISEG